MSARTLILGWGNPGRGDDGLGPEFVRLIARSQIPTVVVDTDYQLQVEDAAEIAGFQRVVFVDADRLGAEPFWLERLHPDGTPSFSTHSVAPGAILALARDLFQVEPEAWILGIRGYQFDEFGERLSDRARSNLDRAVEYMKAALLEADLAEVGPDSAKTENARGYVGEICQTTSP
jgi:hydrogenase maturation protease